MAHPQYETCRRTDTDGEKPVAMPWNLGACEDRRRLQTCSGQKRFGERLSLRRLLQSRDSAGGLTSTEIQPEALIGRLTA
jgi:hypothetical protein